MVMLEHGTEYICCLHGRIKVTKLILNKQTKATAIYLMNLQYI
jgi:hypothetical protein